MLGQPRRTDEPRRGSEAEASSKVLRLLRGKLSVGVFAARRTSEIIFGICLKVLMTQPGYGLGGRRIN